MKNMATLASLMLILGSPVKAQLLTVSLGPNPVPLGAPITISIADTYDLGLQLPSGCVISSIHAGVPNGQLIPTATGCSAVITPIPVCGSGTVSQTWVPGASGTLLLPGLYYMKVSYWDAGFTTLGTEWIPFNVQSTGSPTLSMQNTAVVGQSLGLVVASPLDPGAPYIMAASATTNAGFPLGSTYISLDPDAVFALSFPNPLPGLFDGFQGNLDGVGQSTGIAINIPNIPTLACLTLRAQGIVLPLLGTTPIKATNAVTFSIQ